MIDKEIKFKSEISNDKLEEFLRSKNLTVVLKTTLKSKQNAVHWHLKSGKEKGILEITFLTGSLILLSVHENRNADWIASYLKEDFWEELNL